MSPSGSTDSSTSNSMWTLHGSSSRSRCMYSSSRMLSLVVVVIGQNLCCRGHYPSSRPLQRIRLLLHKQFTEPRSKSVSTHVSEQEARQVAEAARETEWKLPSFGKELFLGNFKPELIYPQPQIDPDKARRGEEFLQRLRTVLVEKIDPLEIEREAKIHDEAVEALKEIGALGMKTPEEYGGLGLSQVHYNEALAMAGMWHAAISTLLSAHQSIGLGEPLRLFGSEEQKREWLPKVAKDHISAFLLTEPDVGSDPARMSATAVPSEDGAYYTVNGTKLWATNGVVADVVVVMAVVPKTEDSKGGITAFICPTDLEGIKVEHRNEFMG